jgi:Reverse transcriptase (RNA-dependent DNA polymerase)
MSRLINYITAAKSGFPGKESLPNDTDILSYMEQALLRKEYHSSRVGDRALEVPAFDLKFAHKVLHQILLDIIPEFKGTHALAESITAELPKNTAYIRTDIKKCFPSVNPTLALPFITDRIDKSSLALDVKSFAKKAIGSVFSPLTTGLSTGSPASPAMLAAYLSDMPEQPSKTFRYVDDMLFLGATSAECKTNLDTLQSYLTTKGLAFNPAKTQEGAVHDGFNFIGIEFGPKTLLAKKAIVPIDLKSQFPLNYWNTNYQLGFDGALSTYEPTKTGVMYRADTLYEKTNSGSLDALCILSACTDNPDLQAFARNSTRLLDSNFAHGLHSRIYKGYIANVKTPRESGGTVVAPEAEKVLAGLLVETHLLETGELPTSAVLKAKYPNLAKAFSDSNTGQGEYHKLVKQLFKLEYALLNGKGKRFKPDNSFLDELAESDDPFALLKGTPVLTKSLESKRFPGPLSSDITM